MAQELLDGLDPVNKRSTVGSRAAPAPEQPYQAAPPGEPGRQVESSSVSAEPERPFPDFLRPAFSAQDLEDADSTIAVISASGELLWVNAAWARFAEQNGMTWRTDAYKSYFDGIAPPMRDFYRTAFARALATQTVFSMEYECSSPDALRRFHCRALPIRAHGLILEHSLITSHPHEPDAAAASLAPEAYRRDDGFILQCSNCRRVHRPGSRA